jgi:hypothetical protein
MSTNYEVPHTCDRPIKNNVIYVAAEFLAVLLLIQETPGSDLGPEISYRDQGFRD